VRLAIDAPRNLWVRGPDVDLELGLERGFTVAMADETRLFGTVAVRRGHVSLIGRRFDLSPGASVAFGGDPARPTLDVQARYRAEKALTNVVVVVHGPPDDLSFALSSPEHPEFGDTELLAIVATGRLPSEPAPAGSTAGGQAASILGGVVASRMQSVLAHKLPLDVLTIEPGEGVSGTRLEAGTYLGSDLYVAYVGRVGGEQPFRRENRNELHLEYQLTRRWSFEAGYGDAKQGSADLIWTKRY
jgi:translocation and assembly module TamB